MSIKLKLDKGFDKFLESIQSAGGDIDKVVKDVVTQSANTIDADYRAAMKEKGVSDRLINDMPAPRITTNGNSTYAEVGYKKGSYDPKNPTDGYKAVFLNYGTPRVSPRNFITEMKEKAYPKVKQQQQEALEKILGDLQA